jgi:predicted phosphoribosyltransferase
MSQRFRDRKEAGRELGIVAAERYGGREDVLVLGLPRGGVPIAHEVAAALGAPLDVFVVRKLGLPGQTELAMGAIASGGVTVLNREVLDYAPISEKSFEAVVRREQRELGRRERAFRGDKAPLDVQGKIVIVVDDGLATGSTMRAAVRALRQMGPQMVVVAVPVAAVSSCRELRSEADDVICLRTPEPFEAVGLWYDDFEQTTDEEVSELLGASESARPARSPDRSEG